MSGSLSRLPVLRRASRCRVLRRLVALALCWLAGGGARCVAAPDEPGMRVEALRLQGSCLSFDLSNPADRLVVAGDLTTGGTNYLRLATGGLSSLAPGVYPLITGTGRRTLAAAYQMDGGAALSVPATSLIKQVGSTFYRLTPRASDVGAEVVVAPAPANVVRILPLGSSITEGVSSQRSNYAGGGYRGQLYQRLVNDGRFTPEFVGSNTVLDRQTPSGYNVLSGAGQLHHEGHGGYTSAAILANLNANAGTRGNGGGFWLAPGKGVEPDYVTFSVGGNDYGNDGAQTTGPLERVDATLTEIQRLRPDTHILLANLFYRTQKTKDAAGRTVLVGDLQDRCFNPLVPEVVFNHVLAGHHVSFVDQSDAVTPGNDTARLGPDGIHPLTSGYQAMADAWYDALANGAAYWTGARGDGRWDAVADDGRTNFAQNHRRTTPRRTAPDASTDVYFNDNATPLATTLGADLTVRGVHFVAGASGPVTVGGSGTLTVGASPAGSAFAGVGGITVQDGSGAHTISVNVVLGGPQSAAAGNRQVWGNVSPHDFTVTGDISGACGLVLTNSYAIRAPAGGTDPAGATVTRTGSGTGRFVLSGRNTYAGGTTVRGGTLVVCNAGGSGTGRGPVCVERRAALVNEGRIAGDVTVDGVAGGSGNYAGAVIVRSGGVFAGAATVDGGLYVEAGGRVDLPTGALTVRGRVVNHGTIHLGRGAALIVGGDAPERPVALPREKPLFTAN